jgi:hypothetical protein
MSKREHEKPKLIKPKRKVKLPCDRTGAPIHIGDVLAWDNGERMQVATLTYYGEEYKVVGCWTAEDEDGEMFADNLDGSLIVWRAKS